VTEEYADIYLSLFFLIHEHRPYLILSNNLKCRDKLCHGKFTVHGQLVALCCVTVAHGSGYATNWANHMQIFTCDIK